MDTHDASTTFFFDFSSSGGCPRLRFLSAHTVPNEIADEQRIDSHTANLERRLAESASILEACEAHSGADHAHQCSTGDKSAGEKRAALCACRIEFLVFRTVTGNSALYFYSNQLYCSMRDIDSEVCKKYADAALSAF